jgi:hypothetical protein
VFSPTDVAIKASRIFSNPKAPRCLGTSLAKAMASKTGPDSNARTICALAAELLNEVVGTVREHCGRGVPDHGRGDAPTKFCRGGSTRSRTDLHGPLCPLATNS